MWPLALAVLAAIAASDTICGLQLGRYNRSQDHDSAATLLETVDLPDHTVATTLRGVLHRTAPDEPDAPLPCSERHRHAQ